LRERINFIVSAANFECTDSLQVLRFEKDFIAAYVVHAARSKKRCFLNYRFDYGIRQLNICYGNHSGFAVFYGCKVKKRNFFDKRKKYLTLWKYFFNL